LLVGANKSKWKPYILHIVKDVTMWSIISSICPVIDLFSHEKCFKWWVFMWPFDYWVMFSGGHVYSIFIPWSYLKWYPKIKASWNYIREKISLWHGVKYPNYTRISPTMLGLYSDLSSHPRGEIPKLYPNLSSHPHKAYWRGGHCATMRLCSWTLVWHNASFAFGKQASMVWRILTHR